MSANSTHDSGSNNGGLGGIGDIVLLGVIWLIAGIILIALTSYAIYHLVRAIKWYRGKKAQPESTPRNGFVTQEDMA
jgi:hypothetical protein